MKLGVFTVPLTGMSLDDACAWLAKKGVQPAIIQAIMRHTKYSQSAEYTHIDRQTKIDALNILKEQ